jgi:hypothetical protein
VITYRWEPPGLEEVVALLRDFPARWWIAGGWALELHAGRPLRPHADVDVALLRDDQLALRTHLAGWDVRIAHAGKLEPWPDGQRVELSRHGLWARRRPDGPWELEVLLEEHDENAWRYRRDPRITVPLDAVGLRTASGIPFLRPELVLLFKSKEPGPNDEADLEAALPVLAAAERARLRSWLARAHPWLPRL